MNIFVLDENPYRAAQSLCDIHINKMVLETAQLLCTYLNEKGITTPYKSTHINHPCNVWLRENDINVDWLCWYFGAITDEYRFRYNKNHKCQIDLIDLFYKNIDVMKKSENYKIDFVQVMPDDFKRDNAIEAYRSYYISKQYTMKRKMKWTNRNIPEWFF